MMEIVSMLSRNIVCSSSKDGDKFWGAPGSKLWVDDIEVIYKK